MPHGDEGCATLHTRVETWECDFNGHLNTRFYCRNFQSASEVLRSLASDHRPGRYAAPRRHVRFYRELKPGDAVEIRSFSTDGLATGPATAHVMWRNDEVTATALDLVDPPGELTPPLPGALAPLVLPRSLTGPAPVPWLPDPAVDMVVEVGPARAEELNGAGGLRFEACVARSAVASHFYVARLGFTQAFTRASGTGRMLVEMRHTPAEATVLGNSDMLRVASRLRAVGEKCWTAAHMLYTQSGAPISIFEYLVLTIDLNTRKATEVPEFLRSAAIAS